MTETPYIFHALEFDGKGGATPLSGESISEKIRENVLAWVHLDANDPRSREWLEKEADYLDPLILSALMDEETRPRLEEYDEGMLLIVRGVNLNDDSDPEDMVSIRLWVDPHRIISLRRRKSRAVQDIRLMLEEGQGPKYAGDFVAQLLGALFDRMEPVFGKMDDEIAELEEMVLANPDQKLRTAISNIRTQIIMFRRNMAPQCEVIARLRELKFSWITASHKRELQEHVNRITRYLEDLDEMRDRAQVLQDELVSALTDRLNSNMFTLSIVGAIFLPLGFITGLLGMNVGGIPGAENNLGFTICIIIMTALMVMQIMFFRWRKWF